jgi:hypothetical protein
VLLCYLAACRAGTIEAVRETVSLLWDWLDASDEDIARDAQFLTLDARDRAQLGNARAEDFLPLFDLAESGKKVWMLPNLQCLTNIYGRINQSRTKSLDGVPFVHDEQLQYAKVLRESKALMEQLAGQYAIPVVPFADYQLKGRADLQFASYREEPCLQAADLLAGCGMRYARDAMRPMRRVDRALRDAFFDLLGISDPVRAIGVNLVFTQRALDNMDLPTFQTPWELPSRKARDHGKPR